MAAGGTCFDGVQQSAIDSLVINSCPEVGGADGYRRRRSARSYIGTDATGTVALPNVYGIDVPGLFRDPTSSSADSAPGEGNLISGNYRAYRWRQAARRS